MWLLGHRAPRGPIRARWRGKSRQRPVDATGDYEARLSRLVLLWGAIAGSTVLVQVLGHLLQDWVRDEIRIFLTFYRAYVSRQVRDDLVWSGSNKRVFKVRRRAIVAV